MRAAALAVAFMLATGPCVGAPAVYGPVEVDVVNPMGSTLEEAEGEVRNATQRCRPSGDACGTTPLTPRQLMPLSTGCGNTQVAPGWRRAGDLKDADRYVTELARRAAAREVFDCAGTNCLAVVRTTLPAGKVQESGVSTLSVCQVQMVQSVASPPVICADAVMRSQRSGVLLRAAIGNSSTMCSMGLRDFDALFKGQAGDVDAVRKLVGEVLRSKPFNLTVMEQGHALVGTRAHVASDLLAGWREWTTVRVDVDTRGADAGTIISTTLLVSKQATASREAWTPASEPQETAYIDALRKAFERRGGSLITGVGR